MLPLRIWQEETRSHYSAGEEKTVSFSLGLSVDGRKNLEGEVIKQQRVAVWEEGVV